jgi:hypothetical protein
MGDRPFKKAQIDRIDNTKGYSPGNCRWVTPSVNARNKSSSKIWIVKGKTFTRLKDAAEYFGVSSQSIFRWCRGGEDNRYGVTFGPKQNCKVIKLYENS